MELQKTTLEQLIVSNAAASVELLLSSPALYCYKANIRTELDIIKRKNDTLATLENNQQGAAVALLSSLVANLCDAFNVGKNMDGTQCMETAIGILEDFPQFTADDIALCFNKAKKGAYGKVFDRMDSATIFGFLDQYHEAKLEAIEQYNRALLKPQEAPISAEEKEANDRLFAENIAKIKELLNAPKTEKPAPSPDPMYELHQGWLRQFDTLHMRRGKLSAGIKFVYRYGRWLDVNAYLTYKQRQYQEFVDI